MIERAPDKRALLQYSLIALPLSFAGLPLYIHMPDYYALEFGLGIGALGLVLLIIRLFDAIQDPIIGYIIDRNSQKYSAILYVGVTALTLGIGGLSFGPPIASLGLIWFAVLMILATTGFSIISILVNMMGGFWKKSDTQRARISSWREAVGLCGLLLAALLPTILQTHVSAQNSFMALFATFVILITVALFLFKRFVVDFINQNQFIKTKNDPSPFGFWPILFGQDKSFFALTFLSFLSASLPAVLVIFFVRDYLNVEEYTGVFLALYFVSGAIFMGAWSKLAESYNLYKIWLWSMLLSVITFAGAVLLSSGDSLAYGIICILSGIALGADLALPPAIVAGRITAHKKQSIASQYYAALALLPKIAMALAAGMAFLALDIAGFQADKNNTAPALTTLLVAYTLTPCFLKIFSILILQQLIKAERHTNEINKRSTNHGTINIS